MHNVLCKNYPPNKEPILKFPQSLISELKFLIATLAQLSSPIYL